MTILNLIHNEEYHKLQKQFTCLSYALKISNPKGALYTHILKRLEEIETQIQELKGETDGITSMDDRIPSSS